MGCNAFVLERNLQESKHKGGLRASLEFKLQFQSFFSEKGSSFCCFLQWLSYLSWLSSHLSLSLLRLCLRSSTFGDFGGYDWMKIQLTKRCRHYFKKDVTSLSKALLLFAALEIVVVDNCHWLKHAINVESKHYIYQSQSSFAGFLAVSYFPTYKFKELISRFFTFSKRVERLWLAYLFIFFLNKPAIIPSSNKNYEYFVLYPCFWPQKRKRASGWLLVTKFLEIFSKCASMLIASSTSTNTLCFGEVILRALVSFP